MPYDALEFQAARHLGSKSDVVAYYSFGYNNEVAGTTGIAVNQYPSSTGNYNLRILAGTGANAAAAQAATTTLLNGGKLNLSNSSASTTGYAVNFTNSSFLFSFEKNHKSDGVLFGALKRVSTSYLGNDYISSRGFNIGVNSRNRLFFQTIGNDGDKIITSDIELADRNVCSLSIAGSELTFARYDFAGNYFESESFFVDSRFLRNNEPSDAIFFGTSDNYYKTGRTFSGYLEEFAVISGAYNPTTLKNLASGFLGTLSVTPAVYSTGYEITGYTVGALYATGVTGYNVSITGNLAVPKSGVYKTYGVSTSVSSVAEGEAYVRGTLLNAMGDYSLEKVGALIRNDVYSTTGDDAFATRGLSTGTVSVTGYTHSISYSTPDTENLALYSITPLTGAMTQYPTGIGRVPLTRPVVTQVSPPVTGLSVPASGFAPYQFNYLYYKGER